jgi:diguanylate cyclase (GGDEF)-like protein
MGAAHGCDDDGSTMHGDTGAYLQAEQSRIASTGTGSAARAPSVNTARCAAPVTAVPDRFGWSASVDPLTGLADRSALMQRLDGALASGPLPGSLAVLYLDIDALRLVNQSFGHEAGDALLRTVADLLVDLLGSGALVTRFGGDTFVALLEGASREDAEAAARRVLERFRSPIAVGDIRIAVAWSIGVACNRRSSTPSSLLRDASGAMVEAKCGTDLRLHVSQPGTRARARRRLQLTADLAGVTGRDELDVHYQPIVHAVDGTLHGFEALVRWRHPEHGWIPPAHFIPLAEDSGAIHAVGAFALRKAVETAVAWDHLRTPTSDLVVAVNVSPRQLLHPGFIDLVTDVLGITGLPARRLTLELTERLLVEEPERVGAVLEHLLDRLRRDRRDRRRVPRDRELREPRPATTRMACSPLPLPERTPDPAIADPAAEVGWAASSARSTRGPARAPAGILRVLRLQPARVGRARRREPARQAPRGRAGRHEPIASALLETGDAIRVMLRDIESAGEEGSERPHGAHRHARGAPRGQRGARRRRGSQRRGTRGRGGHPARCAPRRTGQHGPTAGRPRAPRTGARRRTADRRDPRRQAEVPAGRGRGGVAGPAAPAASRTARSASTSVCSTS